MRYGCHRNRMLSVRWYIKSHARLRKDPRVSCRLAMRKKVLSSTMPSLHVSIACSGYRSGWRRMRKVSV